MNNFKDFGIKSQIVAFTGDKISVKKLVDKNTLISVLKFKVEESKKKPGTDYLTMQIEIDGVKHVVFTGSAGLISQIRQVPEDKFPFTTIIKKDSNDFNEFT